MKENVFVDGLEKLHMLGGAARMEFFVLLPSSESTGGHPIGARLVDRYGKSVHLPGPFSSAFRDEAVQVLATAALSPG